MPANYVLLASQTVGNGGVASVTFANLPPSGYTDLKIVTSLRAASTDANWALFAINGGSDTAINLRHIIGDGSSVASQSYASGRVQCARNNQTANIFASSELYIPNYTASGNKPMSLDSVQETNASNANMNLAGFLWTGSGAVTSISFTLDGGGNFAAGSTFYVYGLAAVGTTPVLAPFASGGDVIANDGTYWYHAFKTTGAFVPAKALSCDYLVVGGGGGSGRGNGTSGGGGAGGLRSTVTATGGGGSLESAISVLSGTSYTVTVGAGGAGTNSGRGTNGSNSVFSTITSIGGGGSGGSDPQQNASSGGSGGGGGEEYSTYGTGGAGTSGQGYAGSQGGSSPYRSGGGGGAGAAALSSSANGGAGVAISAFATPTATGVSNYYAGGGGGGGTTGGSGGAGGGGTGSSSQSGQTAGVANTGGGAGGMYVGTGLSGGSGIVIIRYAMA